MWRSHGLESFLRYNSFKICSSMWDWTGPVIRSFKFKYDFVAREFLYTVKPALRDHNHLHTYKFMCLQSLNIPGGRSIFHSKGTSLTEDHLSWETSFLPQMRQSFKISFTVWLPLCIHHWHRSYPTPFWDIIESYWVSNTSSLELGLLRSPKLLSDYAAELIWLPISVKP